MAEVLITLGIIGIIAAMTLPNLIGNYQKKVLVTKLKKTYSVLSQAMMRAQLDNGEYDTWPKEEYIIIDDYFNTYYKPYFNGVQLCKEAKDCGYESTFPWKNLSGNAIGWGILSDSTRILFQINDSTTIFIPRNTTGSDGSPAYVSGGLVYVDINGSKSPNILGKDVFLYKIDSKKGLVPYCYNYNQEQINRLCNKNSSGNNNCCTAKIMMDGWEIKDDYPW